MSTETENGSLCLWGAAYAPEQIRRRVGNMQRLAGARSFTFNDGRSSGVRAFDVRNGSGLCFTVLADRGMDIAYCDYQGIPIAWVSDAGIVSPQYHEREGRSFNRTFTGGLLTTCGLTQAGEPCIADDGEALGLHGRISHTPAESIHAESAWEGGDYVTRVTGTLTERNHGAYHFSMRRTIETRMSRPAVIIRDTIVNEGFRPYPLMLIYHINFGFPLLEDGAQIFTSAPSIETVSNASGLAFDDLRLGGPDAEKSMHLHGIQAGPAQAGLFNDRLGLGAFVRFDAAQLPYLMQWKFLRDGYNAFALEPSNCYAWNGRQSAGASGDLPILPPGGRKSIVFTIGITHTLPKNLLNGEDTERGSR